jgi:hypothetical protein
MLMTASIIQLISSFTRPNYHAVTLAKNSQGGKCPVMSKYACKDNYPLVNFPLQFTTQPSGTTGCTYSCPFPKRFVKFRGAMSCLTLVMSIVACIVRLQPHSSGFFMAWQGFLVFWASLWFTVFVLDADAVNTGYTWCKLNFYLKGKFMLTNFQYGPIAQVAGIHTITACSSVNFSGVCFLDLSLAILILSCVFLIRKYMAHIISGQATQHSGFHTNPQNDTDKDEPQRTGYA